MVEPPRSLLAVGFAIQALPLVLLALFPACGSSEEGEGGVIPGRPNLLIYLIDTLRADHLGCYGYSRDTSPVMDRIAEEGVLFENLHAQSNWTQPSVGSIMTSMPPLVFKSITNRLPDSVVTLAEVLKAGGYRTAGFTTTAAVAPEFGFGQGFDVYQESGAELALSERKQREGALFDADTLNEMAFSWLHDNQGNEPFFLYLHSVDPHVPYTPPKEFDIFYPDYTGGVDGRLDSIEAIKEKRIPFGQADRDRIISLYDGEVRFNDHEIGRLVEELRRLGVLDRTLLVIISDHGEELYDRNPYSSGHGHMNLHGELTRIPLIMRLPGRIPAGRRVPALASGLDVMPTILDLLGIRAPGHLTGRSLAPLLEEGSTPLGVTRETFAYRAKDINDLASLRTPERLYLWYPYKPHRIFDLARDASEAAEIPLEKLPAAEKAGWENRMKSYIKSVRDCSLNHVPEEELNLPEAIRSRLEALGYLK